MEVVESKRREILYGARGGSDALEKGDAMLEFGGDGNEQLLDSEERIEGLSAQRSNCSVMVLIL